MLFSYTVSDVDSGKTVKYILKNRLQLSERLVKKLKYASRILLNSNAVFVNTIVSTNDLIETDIGFDEVNSDILPEEMPINIIYEDDYLIALNKSPDSVVHPTAYHQNGTIANALMYYLIKKGIRTRIRPVSRLDRNTSGVIVFALNQYVQEKLILQMKENLYVKEYLGIVHGNFETSRGTINQPIDRKEGSLMLRHVSSMGAPSITHYEVLENLKNSDFVKFILETGRTHQIRVHCQFAGHPLLGDTLYPGPYFSIENLINRHALHASFVSFSHPVKLNRIELYTPIPVDMVNALEILRK